MDMKNLVMFQKDAVAEVTGDIGSWQIRVILMIFLCKIPCSWFMACVIYTAPSPKPGEVFCKPPVAVESNDTLSVIKLATQTDRKTDRHFKVDFCNVKNSTKKVKSKRDAAEDKKGVLPCEKFEHKSEYSSLVAEFDLVCSKQLLVSVTQFFHSLGTLFGGLLASEALERISPRELMRIGMIFQIFSGVLTGFVTSYWLHCFFRCLTSVFCTFMYTAGHMILCDITNGKAKVIITTIFELFWSIGLIMLPGISIFIDSWTYLYVAMSTPTIFLLFLHRWIADSPRWHLVKGNIDQTLAILLQAAAFNNRKLPLDIEQQLRKNHDYLRHTEPCTFWSIWDGETKKSFIFAAHMSWIWAVMLYNAMVINTRAFGVDHIHVNTVILGFAEMIGILIGLYFILFVRQRFRYVGVFVLVAGILTFFIWLVPKDLKEGKRVGLNMIFCIALKLTNASTVAILTTCTPDLVTPEKKKILMKSVITWSRIFLPIAPFVISLAVVHYLLPTTIFAVLAVFTGIFMCYINGEFWDISMRRRPTVPTIDVFRSNMAIMRSESIESNSDATGIDNPVRVSIEDIWTMAGKTERRKKKAKKNAKSKEKVSVQPAPDPYC